MATLPPNAATSNATSQESAPGFKEAIDQFVADVTGIKNSIGPLMFSADISRRWAGFKTNRFLEKHCIQEPGSNGSLDRPKVYTIPPQHFATFRRLDKSFTHTSIARSLLPEALLVAVVSRFDAFMGRLLRLMFETKPEILQASDKEIRFGDIMKFSDHAALREYVVEKEIESVLRDSHADQFTWLEKKLNTRLTKDLPSWPAFVEIGQRRHLFVHCDGRVSHQYLTSCKDYYDGSGISPPASGSRLSVPGDYFMPACETVTEIGVKLGQVLWRKLLPKALDESDDALTRTCYELLVEQNYKLAETLLQFGVHVVPKHGSERSKLILQVNLAQAHKWSGNAEACTKVLDAIDWSAKGLEFRICVAALREQYPEACTLMKQLGTSSEELGADAYRDWPVFKNARKVREFQETYKEVFGQEMKRKKSAAPIREQEMKDFLVELEASLASSDRLQNDDTSGNNERDLPPKADS